MTHEVQSLIETLATEHSLSQSDYQRLVEAYDEQAAAFAAGLARQAAEKAYGKTVFIRGLIEISNVCKNDCLYCGIRRGNAASSRYRLTPEQILDCTREGYALGFRTFVMQGGEDGWFTDAVLCALIREIKEVNPGCAVTLSLGERSEKSYERLREAGADRYLLRHETANAAHYGALHPPEMSFEHRMDCLKTLRRLGYQTGCGFMVGSPQQTAAHIAQDLKFIEEFRPHMCGVGPFIPHKDTPFRDKPAGSADLTCFLLSLIRLMHPNILLPATTALGSVEANGRERGILSGANVIMPNLSPANVRDKYMLYNNKLSSGPEAAQNLRDLKDQMDAIGYKVVVDRGDSKV